MNVLCTWIAVFIFGSAVGWSIYKESIDYLIEFLLGASFALLIWIAITL
jgi:hypothetical protein